MEQKVHKLLWWAMIACLPQLYTGLPESIYWVTFVVSSALAIYALYLYNKKEGILAAAVSILLHTIGKEFIPDIVYGKADTILTLIIFIAIFARNKEYMVIAWLGLAIGKIWDKDFVYDNGEKYWDMAVALYIVSNIFYKTHINQHARKL